MTTIVPTASSVTKQNHKCIVRATNIKTLFPISYLLNNTQNLKVGDRVYLSDENADEGHYYIKPGVYQIREMESYRDKGNGILSR